VSLVLALVVAAGLGLIAYALRPLLLPVPREIDHVKERMAYYGAGASFAEEVAQLSFQERILEPMKVRLLREVARLTPQDYLRHLDRDLASAGHPYQLIATDFIVVRVAGVVFLTAAGFFLAGMAFRFPMRLGVAVGIGVVFWVATALWLRGQIRGRKRQIELALPNLIDFLVIAVGAGLNLERALARVVASFSNPLTQGLGLALAEVRLGRSRQEALDAYGRASGVPDVHTFIQALLSSERMGVSMAEILHLQAESARWRRREKARQMGARATIKMLIPMVVFIFPTIWLILLGPTIFQLFGKGGF